MPEVWDQGDLSSCTAHAVAAAWEFTARKEGFDVGTPSRLFIWYTGRTRAARDATDPGIQGANTGISIRQAFRAVHGSGAPPEAVWPYDPPMFARKPPRAVYAAARLHKALGYYSVKPTLEELKGALASGFPIAFYYQLYGGMKQADAKGIYDYPAPADGQALLNDKHASLIVGFDDDDDDGRFKIRDSRGPAFGDGGYVTHEYAMILGGAAEDFWVMDKVS
jgi:C1A family cysteine protease